MVSKGEMAAAMTDDIVLGFDPGGESAFGVAILSESRAKTGTVSSVHEAMDWARAQCGDRKVVAAGIDTLLHWSTARGGWRPVDRSLRVAYPSAKNSVLSANGLYGSMAIGGMALAIQLRQHWPSLVLNETHPKLLFSALSGGRYRKDALASAIEWFVSYAKIEPVALLNDHEFDAVMSAWVTHAGLQGHWSDLVQFDDDRLLFPAGPVKYLWPSQLLSA
jgi:Protein of unknown function (DUF429)